MPLAALALAAAADPQAEAFKASFAGWSTNIEDDLGHADERVTGLATDGCVTTIAGEQGR